MTQPIHRERQVLSGLGIQILVVGFLVFAYSQAGRQMRSQKEMVVKLREQLEEAKVQVARESAKSNVQNLERQVTQIQSQLLAPQKLEEMGRHLKLLAESFGFMNVEVKEGLSRKSIEMPASGNLSFSVEMRTLTLSGSATTRQVAAFLRDLEVSLPQILCPLEAMTLSAKKTKESLPVEVSLEWAVAVSPEKGSTAASFRLSDQKPPLAWGPREEPFLPETAPSLP